MRAFDLQSGSTNAPARIHHAEVKLSHRAPVPVPRITPIDGALLQRKPGCACGGDCPRCQGQHGVQTKLKVNTPGDQYEQEADRVAEQVMQMPGPFRLRGATGFTKQPDTVVQRKCARCDDEDEGFIQKKAPASHEGATNKLNI